MIDHLDPCPCGQPGATAKSPVRPYGDCCGRWHAGPEHLQAPGAETLMRSRYSAFVLGLTDYLLATWHPDTRPAGLDPDETGLTWLGLTIKRSHQVDADHATVEFVARSKLKGRAHRLHEVSRFERRPASDARYPPGWVYRDGDLLA